MRSHLRCRQKSVMAEISRGGTDPVAERRSAFDRERKRRASAKAPPAESRGAPANDNLIDRTRQVWQRSLGRSVSVSRPAPARPFAAFAYEAPPTSRVVPRWRYTHQAIQGQRLKPDAAGTQSIDDLSDPGRAYHARAHDPVLIGRNNQTKGPVR